MKPIKFKEANVVLGKGQDEYIDLPALRLNDDEGRIICCISFGLWDRIKMLFIGKIWHSQYTFGKTYQPILLETKKPFKTTKK